MTSSNQLRIAFIEESTFGSTPSTPNMLTINSTGHGLGNQNKFDQDPTIRSDRNVTDLVRMDRTAGGSINYALRYSSDSGAESTLLRYALQSGPETASASTTSASNTATTITLQSASNLSVGDIVRIRTGSSVLLGYFPILSIAGSVITIDGTITSGQAAGLTVVRGAKMKNGTTQKSMSVEIGYVNTGLYEVFSGCVVDAMDFSVATEQMITGSYTIIGKAGSGVSTSPISGATYAAASTTTVMESVDHIPNFRVGGVNYAARSISVNLANGGEPQKAIGTLGVTAVRSGTFTVKGQIACYFSSITEYNKMIAATASSFLMVTQDTAGNAYSWYMPTVKYGGVSVPVSGQDTDVIMTLDYQAIYNSTIAATILVQRFEN